MVCEGQACLRKTWEFTDDDFVVRFEKPDPKLCSNKTVVVETRIQG